MKLLQDEEKLLSFKDDRLLLTNYRIHMKDIVWGQDYSIIIFLENISSIETKYISKIFLLIIGLIIILAGVFIGSESSTWAYVAGGILIAIWFITRQYVMRVSSNGGSSLNYVINAMDDDKIIEFINEISSAKQKRINQLNKV